MEYMRTCTFPTDILKQARSALLLSENVHETKRLQCIVSTEKGLTADIVASFTGLTVGYIRQVWHLCRHEWLTALLWEKRWKARGNAHMTLEEEMFFLEPFIVQAEKWILLTQKILHKAHQERVSQEHLDASVTARLLKRHGWRKIAPRPEHPNYDPLLEKNFKEVIFPPGYDPYEHLVHTRRNSRKA